MESPRRTWMVFLTGIMVSLLVGLPSCSRPSASPLPEKPKQEGAAADNEFSVASAASESDASTAALKEHAQGKQKGDDSPEAADTLPADQSHASEKQGERAERMDRAKALMDRLDKSYSMEQPTEQEATATSTLEEKKADALEEEFQLPTEEQSRRLQEELEKKRHEELKKFIATLGAPLVDRPEDLKRVDKIFPVWIDSRKKQVVLLAEVCQIDAPLEMFACLRGWKEHEAVVAAPTKAYLVHTALLAIGAKSGHPVKFGPEGQYKPAEGTEIEITVRWKDKNGQVQTARAQEWIKNMQTGKPLQYNWVFGGSGFWKDENGQEYYQAEGGDFICVSNFTSAMLDLPIESSDRNANLLFQANPDRVPPRGTAVTILLSPKLETTAKPDEKQDEGQGDENERMRDEG